MRTRTINALQEGPGSCSGDLDIIWIINYIK